MRLTLLSLLLFSIQPGSATCFQNPPQSTVSAASAQPISMTFPNTTDGLQNLINAILSAIRDKDQSAETALIHSLVIPPESTWFTDTFGNAFGTRLNRMYRDGQADMEVLIKYVYEKDVVSGYKNPTIQWYTDPEKVNAPVDRYLNSMNDIVPVYEAKFGGDRRYVTMQLTNGKTFYQTANDPDGYFIYDRGGFRFIPRTALAKLPEQRPMRITLDAKTMMVESTKQVSPKFSSEAIKEGVKKDLTGAVIIELVVGVDGNVKQAKIIQGNPILAGPVLEAANQDTFTPTTLDGDPVEVIVQMPFNFEFHRQ